MDMVTAVRRSHVTRRQPPDKLAMFGKTRVGVGATITTIRHMLSPKLITCPSNTIMRLSQRCPPSASSVRVTKQAPEVELSARLSGLIFVFFWPLLPTYFFRIYHSSSYRPTCTYLGQQSVCLDKCQGQARLPTLLPRHLRTARWKGDLWLNCRATS